ncbi:Rap30/74 interaction domain-containing protein [Clathrospora elynae]|uniref:Rap30/74 interaction domain-containing protein n=1 Tax=Clathrospora elynae TaxID=706981 RepID=A0A6A5T6M1_9PLEO|nr:Rap30/74 interaction domain-containing protein [Clathrospora elynae]
MNGTPPNGQQPPPRRRRPRPQADVLRKPRRPLQNITRPLVSLTQMNEAKKPAPGPANDGTQPKEALRNEFLAQGASVYPLVATRRDLKELRHHVMRLQSKGRVDITDTRQFAAPVRLHRRDPRAPPSGVGSHVEEEDSKEDMEEMKERERIEQQKDERRKVREANQAMIAPSGTRKPTAFQKKTEQKYRPDDTPEAKKRQLLRYEETLPWHLEDYDNKQTWVGTYESELSEAHVMLSATRPGDPNTSIQLAPMERWYRFNVKSKVKPTGDDLDKILAKAEGANPQFFQNLEARMKKRQTDDNDMKTFNSVRTRVGGGGDDEGRIKREDNDDGAGFVKREADADDIDFNLDEDFADDEEGLNGLFEGEEQDVKDATEKLKRDQLQAALWDRNEQEVHRKEEQDQKLAEELRATEKGTRKALVRREKKYDYLDSDPENPYITESESDTDSETERQQAKDEAEKKAAAEVNGKAPEAGTAPTASGASTKGSNTPVGNTTKLSDIKSKKRPGSPNLSEASGNESSRKKRKKEKKEKNRIMLGGGSPAGSPGTSRAGSPAANGSRASSPSAPAPAPPRLPSAKEIYESLPPQGMNIQSLIVLFKGRVDKTNTARFIKLVKAVSSFDKQKSWLTPLEKMPSEEHISAFMSAANAQKAA